MDGAIRGALRAELKRRMAAHDRPAVQVLRIAVAAIENAEAQPIGTATQTEVLLGAASAADVPRRVVTDDEARRLVAAELAELEEAAVAYRALGRAEAAADADAQAAVLREVLVATA